VADRERDAANRAEPADGAAAAALRAQLVLARIRNARRLLAAVQGADRPEHAGEPGAERKRMQLLPSGRFGCTCGFEFMGHGFVQGPMHKLNNRADTIKRAVETIAKFTGKPPRSWESPGLTETEETLDLLRLNGIEYVADWVMDDLPQDIATPPGTITTIPYSAETNDIVIHALQHLPSEQFLKRCTEQFDRLYLEGATNARIMAISIHRYITGVPHRIKYLEALLDYVIGHDGVALMTASEIGDWYRAEVSKS